MHSQLHGHACVKAGIEEQEGMKFIAGESITRPCCVPWKHHEELLVELECCMEPEARYVPAWASNDLHGNQSTGFAQILPSQIPKPFQNLFQNLFQNPLPPQDWPHWAKQPPKLPRPAYKVVRVLYSPCHLTVDLKKSKTFPNPNSKFHTFPGPGIIKVAEIPKLFQNFQTCANPESRCTSLCCSCTLRSNFVTWPPTLGPRNAHQETWYERLISSPSVRL